MGLSTLVTGEVLAQIGFGEASVEVIEMYAGWMIAGMVFGALAAVIVWTLIVALLVTWAEDRHQRHCIDRHSERVVR